MGDPAAGFLEPANKGPKSAHLFGWGIVDFAEWTTTAANTLPASPCEWGRDLIYASPKLVAANFDYARLPNVNFAFMSPPSISDN